MLFSFLGNKDMMWNGGSPLRNTNYKENGSETCYINNRGNRIMYGDCDCYEEEGKEIVKFSDIVEE